MEKNTRELIDKDKLSIFKRIWGKPEQDKENTPKDDFCEGIWEQVMGDGENRKVEPVRSYAVDKKLYYMWCSNDVLYIAPRILMDVSEVEKIPLSQINKFFVNPKAHNEICLTYVDEQDKKRVLRFRSQALENLRLLLPQHEYKFDRKTMQLGNQDRMENVPKIGDLRDVRSGGEFEEYLTTLFKLYPLSRTF